MKRIRSKMKCKSIHNIFPITALLELYVVMEIGVLFRSGENINQSFPHPNDAADKIKLQSEIFRFEIVNTRTHGRTPAGVPSCKLTLLAIGSGELMIIHRHNDEYITVVIVFVLQKNANSDTLWVSLGPCLISQSFGTPRGNFPSRIDAVLETGSSRPLIKSA